VDVDTAELERFESEAVERGAFDNVLTGWNGNDDLWVFAYGSLIWRPSFEWAERRCVTLKGYHRSLCLWSHDHRGSQDVPGVVFGLNRGGSCKGVAYRIEAGRVRDTFAALWAREMITNAYTPRWVRCESKDLPVHALAFLLNRTCQEYTGTLPQERLLTAIRQAVGMSGPCMEYVVQTHSALHDHGIHDKSLCNLVRQLREAI